MKTVVSILITFLLVLTEASAQSDRNLTRRGNKDYRSGNFSDAELNYRKAIDKNPRNEAAGFNLGNAAYQQENYQEAGNNFKRIADMSNNASMEAKALYNLGNSLLSQQKYAESIEAFKRSLRLNPDDEDARYNFEYARRMLEQQQQNNNQDEQQQNNDQQDQQQNQQQEQQQQEQQEQQQQDQQQNQQESEQQQNQQQSQQQQKLSKEEAERMLQALTNEERQTLDRLNQEKARSTNVSVSEKDW